MPETRYPATAGQFHGELRVTHEGIEFVPITTYDGRQMCLGLTGWGFRWSDVAGLERVAARSGLRPGEPGGVVRVHYDGCARFVSVTIHGSLRAFFEATDALAAPVREVA
ncbi:MAG: hypothetical protein JWN72_1385 [Thermoleophilia bacterium]|nr:hypothetical protein [Thermoleophilia bacterium]